MTFGNICSVSASDDIFKARQHRLDIMELFSSILIFGYEEIWSARWDKRDVSCSSNWFRDLISIIKIPTEKISNHYHLEIIMICILPRTTKIRNIRVDKNSLRQSRLVFSCGLLACSKSEVLPLFTREESSFLSDKSSDCLSWFRKFIFNILYDMTKPRNLFRYTIHPETKWWICIWRLGSTSLALWCFYKHSAKGFANLVTSLMYCKPVCLRCCSDDRPELSQRVEPRWSYF